VRAKYKAEIEKFSAPGTARPSLAATITGGGGSAAGAAQAFNPFAEDMPVSNPFAEASNPFADATTAMPAASARHLELGAAPALAPATPLPTIAPLDTRAFDRLDKGITSRDTIPPHARDTTLSPPALPSSQTCHVAVVTHRLRMVQTSDCPPLIAC
jgi:hypothetical protein